MLHGEGDQRLLGADGQHLVQLAEGGKLGSLVLHVAQAGDDALQQQAQGEKGVKK